MGRLQKVILSVVLVAVGLVGVVAGVVFLAGQGLDRAEKWVSVGGVVVSAVTAAAGLWLGWLTWRHTATPQPVSTPPVHAGGLGGVAVGGANNAEIGTEVSGTLPPPVTPSGTGGVNATGAGAVAVGGENTGPIRTKVTGPGGDTS